VGVGVVMEQWTSFLQERWYMLVIAIVLLFVVIGLVKTVMKWILVLAILAGIVVYGYQYKDKFGDVKTSITDQVVSTAKDQAMKAAMNEAKEAKYTQNADGTYTIKSKSVQIDGKPGSNDAKVTFMGQSFNIKIDETVQRFVDQAKQNK
jgi:uncharacterized membrane protein YkgB